MSSSAHAPRAVLLEFGNQFPIRTGETIGELDLCPPAKVAGGLAGIHATPLELPGSQGSEQRYECSAGRTLSVPSRSRNTAERFIRGRGPPRRGAL